MSDSFIIYVSDMVKDEDSIQHSYLHINCSEFTKLVNINILCLFEKDIITRCLNCGTFTVKAKTVYDVLILANKKLCEEIEVNQETLSYLISTIICNIIKCVGLSDDEYRDLEARGDPIPDFNYDLNDLLDPFEDGYLYELAYSEVTFKIGDSCDVCNKIYFV